jgi:hypothetical protein
MISARLEGTPLFLLVGKDTLFAVYLDNFHFVFLLFFSGVTYKVIIYRVEKESFFICN